MKTIRLLSFWAVLLIWSLVPQSLRAQIYVDSLYSFYQSDTNLWYGNSLDYAGQYDSLFMDLYKPSGDNNCKRPLIVLVHGGAWVSGDKAEPEIVNVARNLAAKGWVVASINWRIGNHKAFFFEPYSLDFSLCSAMLCARVGDSSEVIRANYRGMQDTKGAIRFLKGRASLDSVDINNVFVGGFSAGGYVALTAAFMDKASEKPADCFALPDAPAPDGDLAFCLPAGYSLTRPDLGSVDGDLHLNGCDASVEGVANFYGGIMSTGIIDGINPPKVYLFHQTKDVVVNPAVLKPLARFLNECTLSSCNPANFFPTTSGSVTILDTLTARGYDVCNDILYNAAGPGLDCFDGHQLDVVSIRATNMAACFKPVITANGNNPPNACDGITCVVGLPPEEHTGIIHVYPNPAHDKVLIEFSGVTASATLRLFHTNGQLLFSEQVSGIQKTEFSFDVPPGIYVLEISRPQIAASYSKLLVTE